MPMFFNQVGFGAFVSGFASIVKTDNAVSTTDTNVYTFSTKSIGTAAAGRRVLVGVHGIQSPAVTISSLTVGGNAATAAVSLASEGNISPIAIYVIQVDSGTTADIVVTFSGGALCCGIGVWAAYDLQSSTQTDTVTATADPSTGAIDCVAGGVIVAYGSSYGGAGLTHAWTGLTENFDEVVDGGISTFHTGASDAFATAQTGLSVSMNPSGGTNAAMVAAAFR